MKKSLLIVGFSSLTLFLAPPAVVEVGSSRANVKEKTSISEPVASLQAPLKKTYEDLLGGNDYTGGNCTWAVANWIPVIAGLGNAESWDDNAAYYGVPISNVPRVGAVAQRDGGLGHVALVIAIDGDMVEIREMNSLGLYIADDKWVPASSYRYLYF